MQTWVSRGAVNLRLDSVGELTTIWAEGEEGMEQGALPWRSLGGEAVGSSNHSQQSHSCASVKSFHACCLSSVLILAGSP